MNNEIISHVSLFHLCNNVGYGKPQLMYELYFAKCKQIKRENRNYMFSIIAISLAFDYKQNKTKQFETSTTTFTNWSLKCLF